METTQEERERANTLLHAMDGIKDEYLEDAAEHVTPEHPSDEKIKLAKDIRRKRLRRFLVPLAAALVMVIIAANLLHLYRTNGTTSQVAEGTEAESAEPGDTASEPAVASAYSAPETAETAEKAGSIAGLSFAVPKESEISDLLGTELTASYSAAKDSFAEADYADAEGNLYLSIVETAGVEEALVQESTYVKTEDDLIEGLSVTFEGESEDSISSASWDDGTNSFSIEVYDTGVSLPAMEQLVKLMVEANS